MDRGLGTQSRSDGSRSDGTAGSPSTANPEAAGPATAEQPAKFHAYPFYAPRFWHGMTPGTWLGLLRQGRFRVQPSRLGHLLGVSIATPWNTVLGLTQKVWFAKRLAHAELHGPPVFIIGHWRSGTTLLHELLVRDERYSSPSTFQCFAPHHFLLSEWVFRKFFRWLLPDKRPMDNMATGWDRPQEDEFALMNLGLPSPYRRLAFPREGAVDLDYLDFQNVPQASIDRWLATLRRFLLNVSAVTGRPLVIKSPTHTGRLAQLANAFPDARFIHLTRDPRDLFPSTCRLWRSLAEVQGLQLPSSTGAGTTHSENDKQYVIECLRRMYASFHQARSGIDPNRIIDIRYEDLTADPVAVMQSVYSTLRLSDFETVKPVIESWAKDEHRNYKTNRHQLTAADDAMIREAWSDYFETYGYNNDAPE